MKLVKFFKIQDFESGFKSIVDAMEVLWDQVALLTAAVKELKAVVRNDTVDELHRLRTEFVKNSIAIESRVNSINHGVNQLHDVLDNPPWNEDK